MPVGFKLVEALRSPLSRLTHPPTTRRWAWEQVEKDGRGLVKLGARPDVLRVMREADNHALRGCNIVSLIKEHGGRSQAGAGGRPCSLDEASVRRILSVRSAGVGARVYAI